LLYLSLVVVRNIAVSLNKSLKPLSKGQNKLTDCVIWQFIPDNLLRPSHFRKCSEVFRLIFIHFKQTSKQMCHNNSIISTMIICQKFNTDSFKCNFYFVEKYYASKTNTVTFLSIE